MSKWYKIVENDSFIVEYNKETNTYRVSYFEDNHFKDEICFRGYKELEWKEEVPKAEITWTPEELQEEIRKTMEPPYIYQETDKTSPYIPPACKICPTHPSNGGSGICHCILGLPEIT